MFQPEHFKLQVFIKEDYLVEFVATPKNNNFEGYLSVGNPPDVECMPMDLKLLDGSDFEKALKSFIKGKESAQERQSNKEVRKGLHVKLQLTFQFAGIKKEKLGDQIIQIMTLFHSVSLINCSGKTVGLFFKVLANASEKFFSEETGERIKYSGGECILKKIKLGNSYCTDQILKKLVKTNIFKYQIETLSLNRCSQIYDQSLFSIIRQDPQKLEDLNISFTSIGCVGLMALAMSQLMERLLCLKMIGINKDQKRFNYFLDLVRKRNKLQKLRIDNVFDKKFQEFDKLRLHEVFEKLTVLHFDGVWLYDNRKQADWEEEEQQYLSNVANIDQEEQKNAEIKQSEKKELSKEAIEEQKEKAKEIAQSMKKFNHKQYKERELLGYGERDWYEENVTIKALENEINISKTLRIQIAMGNLINTDFKHLKHLRLIDCLLTTEFLRNLGEFDFLVQLEEINFNSSIFEDMKPFKYLLQNPKLHNIRDLQLCYTMISDAVIDLIALGSNFNNLEILNIEGCAKVTSKGLIRILSRTNSRAKLRKINFRYIPGLNTTVMMQLLYRINTLGITNMTQFDLSECEDISSLGIQTLFQKATTVKSIKFLDLRNTLIEDSAFSTITDMTYMINTLERLDLSNCSNISSDALEEFFKDFQYMRLRKIILDRTQVDDDCISELVDLNEMYLLNLETLSLNQCYLISNKGLCELASCTKLTKLRVLNLKQCKIHDPYYYSENSSSFLRPEIEQFDKDALEKAMSLTQGDLKQLIYEHPQIKPQEQTPFLQALAKNQVILQNLVTLNLKGCLLISTRSIQEFFETVYSPNQKEQKPLLTNFDYNFFFKNFSAKITNEILNKIDNLHRKAQLNFDVLHHVSHKFFNQEENWEMLDHVERINLNSTKIIDQTLGCFYWNNPKAAIKTIVTKNAPLLTHNFLEELLSSCEFKLDNFPNQFELDNFIFDDNKHRVNDKTLKALSKVILEENRKKKKKLGFTYIDLSYNTKVTKQSLRDLVLKCSLIYTHVEYLYLDGTNINDQTIRDLTQLKHNLCIKEIHLNKCQSITQASLKRILRATNLSEYFQPECLFQLKYFMDDNFLKYLSQSKYFKNVRYLDFSFNNLITDEGIKWICLSGTPKLREHLKKNLNHHQNGHQSYVVQQTMQSGMKIQSRKSVSKVNVFDEMEYFDKLVLVTPKIGLIDFTESSIKDKVLETLASSSSQGFTQYLRIITLKGCNEVSSEGIIKLVQGIGDHMNVQHQNSFNNLDSSDKGLNSQILDFAYILRQVSHLLTDDVLKEISLNQPLCRSMMTLYVKKAINITPEGFRKLMESPYLDNLREVNIKMCVNLNDESIHDIIKSNSRSHLKLIRLDNKRTTQFTTGLETLIKSHHVLPEFCYEFFIFKFKSVVSDRLFDALSQEGAEFRSKKKQIKHLSIIQNQNLTTDSLSRFVDSPAASSLESLMLVGTRIDNKFVDKMRVSNQLQNLKKLILMENYLMDEKFINHIMTAKFHKEFDLELIISIYSNLIDDSHLELLSGSQTQKHELSKMRILSCEDSKLFTVKGITLLSKARLLGLRIMNFSGTLITDEGLLLLGQGQHLSEMSELIVNDTPLISTKGLENFIEKNTLSTSFLIMNFLGCKRHYINDDVLKSLKSCNKFIRSDNTHQFVRMDLRDAKQISSRGLIEFFELSNSVMDVRILILQNTSIDDDFLEKVGSLPSLKKLAQINIEDCRFISHKGFMSLIRERREGLLTLKYSQMILNSEILSKFMEKQYISRLNKLDFSDSPIDNSDIYKLVDTEGLSKQIQNLSFMSISRTKVTDDGVEAIANSKYLENLVDLRIRGLKLQSKALRSLIQSQTLCPFFNIENIIDTYVEDRDLAIHVLPSELSSLARSRYLINVRHLNLTGLQTIQSYGIMELAQSPLVENIETIDVSNTKINSAAIMAIACSPYFKNLLYINFDNTEKIDSQAVTYICSSKQLSLQFEFDYETLLQKSHPELVSNLYKCAYTRHWRAMVFTNQMQNIMKGSTIKQFFLYNQYLNNIRELIFYKVQTLDDKLFKYIVECKNMQNLKNLRVYKCQQFKKESIKNLCMHQNFPRLDLNSTIKGNSQLITEDILPLIGNAPILLNSAKLTLKKLGKLPKPSWVDFFKSRFLTNLKIFNLTESKIDDEFMETLSECTTLLRLKELVIKDCNEVTYQGIQKLIGKNCFSAQFDMMSVINSLQISNGDLFKEVSTSKDYNQYLMLRSSLSIHRNTKDDIQGLDSIFNNPNFVLVKQLELHNVNSYVFQTLFASLYLFGLQRINLTGTTELVAADIENIFNDKSASRLNFMLNPFSLIKHLPSTVPITSAMLKNMKNSLQMWNASSIKFNNISFTPADFIELLSSPFAYNSDKIDLRHASIQNTFFEVFKQFKEKRYISKFLIPTSITAPSLNSIAQSKLFDDEFNPMKMILFSKTILTTEVLTELANWKLLLNCDVLKFPEVPSGQQAPLLNISVIFAKDNCRNISKIKLKNILVKEEFLLALTKCPNFRTVRNLVIAKENELAFTEKVLCSFFTEQQNVSQQFGFNDLLNTCFASITDKVIEELSKNLNAVKSLRRLKFKDNALITVQGLRKLFENHYIKSLTELSFKNCEKIDASFITEMTRASLPFLTIFTFHASEVNFTSDNLQELLEGLHRFSSEFDMQNFIKLGFKPTIMNQQVLMKFLTNPLYNNVSELYLDGCRTLQSADLRLIYQWNASQLENNMQNLKIISLKNTRLIGKDFVGFTDYPLFLQLEAIYFSECTDFDDSNAILDFTKGIYFMFNKKFNFNQVLSDAKSLGIITPQFFQQFIQSSYFRFRCQFINVQELFAKMTEDDLNEITKIFLAAQSFSFDITKFINELPQTQKNVVTDDHFELLSTNYKEKYYVPIKELAKVTMGINYLITDPGYDDAFKVSYFMEEKIQKLVSADSLKHLSKITMNNKQYFSVFTNLNLNCNMFRNSYGLQRYIQDFVKPWVSINKKFRDEQREEYDDDEMDNILFQPDHLMDDKQDDHVMSIIENSPQLRKIQLMENNLSDDFAKRLSLFLSRSQNGTMSLPDLHIIDLRGNTRITSFGLKYLYTSLVFRLNIDPNFELLVGDMQSYEEQQQADANRHRNKINRGGSKQGSVLIDSKSDKGTDKNSSKGDDESQISSSEHDASQIQLENDPQLIEEEEKQMAPEPMINRIDVNNSPQFKLLDDEQAHLIITPNREDYVSGDISPANTKPHSADMKDHILEIANIDKQKDEWTKFLKQKLHEESKQAQLEAADKKKRDEEKKTEAAQLYDLRHIMQHVASRGIFHTLSALYFSLAYWKLFWKWMLVFMVVFIPLTLFHIYKSITYFIKQRAKVVSKKIENYVDFGGSHKKIAPEGKKGAFAHAGEEGRTKNDKKTGQLYQPGPPMEGILCCKKKVKPYMVKKVPPGLKKIYFYFDEDIVMLNDILANSDQRLENGLQIRRKNIVRQFATEEEQQIATKNLYSLYLGRYALKKMFYIYLVNFFAYHAVTIGYQVLYPPTVEQCLATSPSIFNDLPYYIYGGIVAVIEIKMLHEIYKIVGAKEIFNFWSLSTLFIIYSSQMAKYDLYTDIQFIMRTYVCENLQARNISYMSIGIISVNVFFNVTYFTAAYLKACEISGNPEEFHNTSMINRFSQLSFISDFDAVAHVLDKFSTSSAFKLEGFFVPHSLQGVLFPQIVLSKLQRVFMEDLPQLGLQLYFTFGQKQDVLLNQQNLIIFGTTLLNMINSLSAAWEAKPSKLNQKTVEMYSKFIKNAGSRWVFNILIDGREMTYGSYLEKRAKVQDQQPDDDANK